MHFVVINDVSGGIIAAQRVAGDSRTVETGLDIHRLIDILIHTHSDTESRMTGHLIELGDDAVEHGIIIVTVVDIYVELVCLTAAGYAVRFIEYAVYQSRDAGYNRIAEHSAVQIVHKMEAVHVQHESVHGFIGVVLVVSAAVLEEIFLCIEPCECIVFGGVDNAAVLGKLDGAPYTGENDLGHIIRLGDKVRCPEL